ncbi:hypothetical protein LSUE1_G000434 [Lachnellula suecica]|uniref:Uncharacterized protein n=1 Tax=Lachnellula suecica TaxID=602035 RepID=A0A8T9CMS3_9HELO|nr:hypothetical protein LSUE1_G000434 [Lachnellula suecica]
MLGEGYDECDGYSPLSSMPLPISPNFSVNQSLGTVEESASRRLQRGSISSTAMSPPCVEEMAAMPTGSASLDFQHPLSWSLSPQYHQEAPNGSAFHLEPSLQDHLMSVGPTPELGFLSNNVCTPSNFCQYSSGCNCFNDALQSLQGLHHHASCIDLGASFDVVLMCVGKTCSNTTLMLLATIIGKIVSFYRDASQRYFDFTPGPLKQQQSLPLTFGSYKISGDDGRWLEMEILLREIRKVEEVFLKFQDIITVGDLDEHGVIHTAVTTYLRQTLNVTFEVLNMRRANSMDH